MRLVCRICILSLFILLASCVSPQLNVAVKPNGMEEVSTIALSPNGGVLADAVGFELINLGFQVIDTAQISSLLVRMNLSEFEILQPQNLNNLREVGIDAMLQVRTVGGYDGRPQSASIRLVSTESGSVLIGATWQNGRAGQQGSMADQDARVDVSEAATQIAKGIAEAINKKKVN